MTRLVWSTVPVLVAAAAADLGSVAVASAGRNRPADHMVSCRGGFCAVEVDTGDCTQPGAFCVNPTTACFCNKTVRKQCDCL